MNDSTQEPTQSWWRRLSAGLKRTSSSLGTAGGGPLAQRNDYRPMVRGRRGAGVRGADRTQDAARAAA